MFLLATIPLISVFISATNGGHYTGIDGIAAFGEQIYFTLESSGEVVCVDSEGVERTLVSGLSFPEGICVSPSGSVLVTEDVPNGRIVSIYDGVVEVIATNLPCPEGVSCTADGTIWFTTGGFEAGELFTSVWRKTDDESERVVSLLSIFSFSDLEISTNGIIYVCSESVVDSSGVSVYALDPAQGELQPFVRGVEGCEGIALTAGGFPMYLASEEGAVYIVESDGLAVVLHQNLASVEDVCVLDGELFVSEDGTGSLLRYPVEN